MCVNIAKYKRTNFDVNMARRIVLSNYESHKVIDNITAIDT